MRLPNGFGNVSRLPGNRRKPYRARLTIGYNMDDTGKRHQQFKTIGYYETREEGIIALANYRQNPYELNDPDITFEDIYNKWSKEHFRKISKKNIQGYATAYSICHPLYNMCFTELRRTHMQHIIDSCGKNYPSLKKLKILFSQLYKFAMQNDLCEKDYSKFLDINQYKGRNPNSYERIPFNQEEIAQLWNLKNSDRYSTIVLMLIYSGCRISELLDLKKTNVNLEERWFYIEEAKTDAGVRFVPISEKVYPFFEQWYHLNDCPYLISSVKKQHLLYRNYYDTYWKPLMKSLNMQHRPHDTRHTCVSMMATAGVDDKLIKKIIGHKGQNLTEVVYTHFELQELIDAINRI
ncbi:MAG: site-specific integrase [Lachnospiraceae bacterium]|nr:site-specific integrase [Lachnospiraceae bacterium]